MSGTPLQSLRSLAALLLVLLPSCAHGPETVPGEDAAVASAIEQGDSLAQVRRKLGREARVQAVSPTEKVLSALYPVACPDVPPRGPGDFSQPPCGAARLLTVRLRDDRVISLEWGDAPPAEPSSEPTAPPAP